MGLGAGEELLQFIQDRLKASEWFQVSGAINAVTNTIEFVPANGKTAVLFEAKIVISTNPTAAASFNPVETVTVNDQIVADLKIDGVVKDKASIGVSSQAKTTTGTANGTGTGFGMKGDGKFTALGITLVGNGTKKITIENVLDDGSAFATMSGWLYTT